MADSQKLTALIKDADLLMGRLMVPLRMGFDHIAQMTDPSQWDAKGGWTSTAIKAHPLRSTRTEQWIPEAPGSIGYWSF